MPHLTPPVLERIDKQIVCHFRITLTIKAQLFCEFLKCKRLLRKWLTGKSDGLYTIACPTHFRICGNVRRTALPMRHRQPVITRRLSDRRGWRLPADDAPPSLRARARYS